MFREELARNEGKAQFISGNSSGLSYHYINESLYLAEPTISKIPQLPKKEVQNFQASTFEKAGLQGPPTGVKQVEWSLDSLYLATKVESTPHTVWIWDMTTLNLASVLIHLNPVASFKFAPHSHQLIIGTG